MSPMLQHTCIRASAGTGKTYQLANRYIALLLLQAQAGGRISPEKIVALTFTRKGAGEFAGRILQRLAAAAGDATERGKLQADLDLLLRDDREGLTRLAPGVRLAAAAKTLQSALVAMIDQFDRLVLGTIDGFMARSVQTLAFELGLGGFEILEPAALDRKREELLGEVFRAVPPKDLASFHQTLKRATLKSSGSLRRELGGFVTDYHELFHALPITEAWGGSAFWGENMPNPPGGEWNKQARELLVRVNTAALDNREVVSGITKSLEWLAGREAGASTSSNPVPTWLAVKKEAGKEKPGKLLEIWPNWPEVWPCYARANSRNPCLVPAAIMGPLRRILKAWLDAECAALSRKTNAIHEIVSGYEALYDRLARRQGRLTFDDLPLLLDEKKGGDAAQSALRLLAFRWHLQFDHWLLDEFQDTSRAQWDVLKPWLDEAIQDNDGTKSVFVVGDPKQSIYGWRGGEPRLFDELTGNYNGTFKEQVMAESWRSRPAVLELVNLVCSPDSNPALGDAEKFSPAALGRWQYEPHVPEEKRQSKFGYAAVLLAAKPETEEDEGGDAPAGAGGEFTDRLAAQARVVRAVLKKVRPLEKGLSCAILARTNKNAQAVAQWLRAHDVPQVMVEGVATLAEQSPVVAALVDALRWLASPADTLAAGHVSVAPLWEILEQPLKMSRGEAPAGAVWRHWRSRVAEIGAPQVTHEWCAALAVAHREPYARYCLHHVSQSARQAGAAVILPDWLAALEQLAVRETAGVGSIHVMTIHKAKGLDFDIVFLPDLDSGGGGRDEILIRRDEQGGALGCLAYPPKWLPAWERELGDFCAAQKAGQDLESLCVLYVALTRAREATFVILNKEKPRKASPARDWILSAVAKPGDAPGDGLAEIPWDAGELQWENGRRDFDAGFNDARVERATAPPAIQLPMPVPRRKRRRPSDAGPGAPAGAGAEADSGGGPDFGTVVHGVFEQIEWWLPGQSLGGDPYAIALILKCLAKPEIRALFTRETARDEALRELPVEFMEQDLWWSGIIDRLVLRRDADDVLHRALVIDFKTDRVETADTLRGRYAGQLTLYRRTVATALQLDEEQVEIILLSTHLEALVPL